ncbi:response regulator [Flagellimonas meridianipacifica]|uniref:Response regulator receiver domain-containing protein n=1 Tax=Flagellimonas meridianipacifica TaxID=1080225 RepID=A0A2T0MH24_9FLAO|nr:response regulator [Allomuricauda pacifica]PRX56865.1 response regulator receiver domain-containing protein [Allomuricauda pacifica]
MKAKKVFLVDDDFIFREAAEVLITSSGLTDEVFHFENGLEAYNRLEELSETPEHLPEIMLLDINMPVMNGWELLEELRQVKSVVRDSIQIHILTSSIAPEDLNLSKEYEFIDGYITKPLTRADLKKLSQSTVAEE